MKDYLIVHSSILPDYFYKVIKVRENLLNHPELNIKEECLKEGISRSTYYKYKDYVFLPSDHFEQKAIISLALNHEKGLLSVVLNSLSNFNISILTISQTLPIKNVANVNLSLDISNINSPLLEVINSLNNIKGVINASLVNFD